MTRPEAGRGYPRRALRRIIRRSGVIAIWNLSTAASRHIRVRPVVVSDGSGGAVPLADGRGRVGVVLGRGAVVSVMALPFAGWAWGDASDRQPLGERPAGTGRWRQGCGRVLADAHHGGRHLPAGAACRCRDRPGAVARTGGCWSAEPPAACSPLPSGGVISGSSRCGEGVHSVAPPAAARPGIWPGSLHRASAESAGRAAMRASWERAVFTTRPIRMSSSGSSG